MVEILVNEFWVQTLGKTRNFSNFGVKKLKLPLASYVGAYTISIENDKVFLPIRFWEVQRSPTCPDIIFLESRHLEFCYKKGIRSIEAKSSSPEFFYGGKVDTILD